MLIYLSLLVSSWRVLHVRGVGSTRKISDGNVLALLVNHSLQMDKVDSDLQESRSRRVGPSFRRWRYLIFLGTRATSRKELPSHTGRSTTSQQVIFLPSDNTNVLTLDAKWLANQTYDGGTMQRVGRKFTIEQTSSTLFTGSCYQRFLRSCRLKSLSQASPVVPVPRWLSP